MRNSKLVLKSCDVSSLNDVQKRKAAEAVVDAALLGDWLRDEPAISAHDRESWIQALIEKPELTHKLFQK